MVSDYDRCKCETIEIALAINAVQQSSKTMIKRNDNNDVVAISACNAQKKVIKFHAPEQYNLFNLSASRSIVIIKFE